MSEKNKLVLKWDEDTYLKGAKVAYDIMMKTTFRRYVGWFFIALVQFGVVAMFRGGSYGLLLLSTLLIIYWYGIRWPMRKVALKRFFHKSPFAGQVLNVSPVDDGLCINDKCVPWSSFKYVFATKDGYLLDMEEGYLFIPKKHFNSSEERKKLSSILREKVEQYKKVEI